MREDFKCARCTNCCKTYWITMLPAEAEAIAKLLKISLERMLEKYCVVLLQLFPAQKTSFSNPLVFRLEKLPKSLRAKLSKKAKASFFLALPSIAFKRLGEKCVMLSKNGLCKVHAVRPMQCKLFPLIGLKEKTSLKKACPFCQGLKGSEKIDLRKNQAHYKKIRQYFETVKNKGFKRVWKHLPSKCIVLLESERISGISGKEFFRILGF